MKKLLILTLSFFLIFANISFASEKDIIKSIDDVTMVNDRIAIMIKSITDDNPLNIDDLKKEIKFCGSILGENSKKMTSLYSSESDIELKRSYSSMLYIMSLYELSLSSMVVYINDNSKTHYLIDTCSSYRNANIALKTIKSIYN